MAGKAGGFPGSTPSARADLVELLGKAILSGLGAGLVLMALTLALAASAQAMPLDAIPMRADAERALAPESAITEPWSGAPVLAPSLDTAVAGALWATPGTTPAIAGAQEEDAQARARPAVFEAWIETPAPAASVSRAIPEISPVVAGSLPAQPEPDLQIALGLAALACLALVAFIGRTLPREGVPATARALGRNP